jgi:hypothetical protein
MAREGALRPHAGAGRDDRLGKRIGSLEQAEADSSFFESLSVTQVLETWVDGQRVSTAECQDHLWAVGGLGAGAQAESLLLRRQGGLGMSAIAFERGRARGTASGRLRSADRRSVRRACRGDGPGVGPARPTPTPPGRRIAGSGQNVVAVEADGPNVSGSPIEDGVASSRGQDPRSRSASRTNVPSGAEVIGRGVTPA